MWPQQQAVSPPLRPQPPTVRVTRSGRRAGVVAVAGGSRSQQVAANEVFEMAPDVDASARRACW